MKRLPLNALTKITKGPIFLLPLTFVAFHCWVGGELNDWPMRNCNKSHIRTIRPIIIDPISCCIICLCIYSFKYPDSKEKILHGPLVSQWASSALIFAVRLLLTLQYWINDTRHYDLKSQLKSQKLITIHKNHSD